MFDGIWDESQTDNGLYYRTYLTLSNGIFNFIGSMAYVKQWLIIAILFVGIFQICAKVFVTTPF